MKSFFRNIRFSFKKNNVNEYGMASSNLEVKDQLRQILPIMVTPMGSKHGKGFQIMASHLSPDRIIFRSSTPVAEHDCLELEFLLPGLGRLTLTSQVQFATEQRASEESFCTRVATGQVPRPNDFRLAGTHMTGQLKLFCTETQKRQIQEFLQRQHLQVRFGKDPAVKLP